MTHLSCQKALSFLPEACPVRLACNSTLKEVCEARSTLADEHDAPCHGGPCSGGCNLALEGGKVEVIKTKGKKR
jgi:hypothetical protein